MRGVLTSGVPVAGLLTRWEGGTDKQKQVSGPSMIPEITEGPHQHDGPGPTQGIWEAQLGEKMHGAWELFSGRKD